MAIRPHVLAAALLTVPLSTATLTVTRVTRLRTEFPNAVYQAIVD